jgi:N-methylhydantoinase A/oxoprolinase/acetone carboxylase beta subunit
MKRIGIDVGGTNTDAVLVDGTVVLAAAKTPTTDDVTSGVRAALARLTESVGGHFEGVAAVMIGTTHFVNAVVQRRGLDRAAALRICLPASASLPPFVDWPEDLAALVNGGVHMVEGGHEYDGRALMPLDEAAVASAARAMRRAGVDSVAISAVFSPLTDACEVRAAEIVREEHPDVTVTLSSAIGRIGLLERENATLLNAALTALARRTSDALVAAMRASGIDAPLYMTQNDGTVVAADTARRFPVFTFASGPTNSMRGAAFLSGVHDALVVDIGGTTTDVGSLRHGFPREANNVVEIGGVRTLFRMPDLLSVGLGGGTLVTDEPLTVGPVSVGHRLTEQALVFGGDVLTLTDVAVAAGITEIGDRSGVAGVSPDLVARAVAHIHHRLYEVVDRMKSDASAVPLIAVGGGAMLVPEHLDGISQVVRVEHHAVANAVGAAIAQISGEADRIYQDMERAEALARAADLARDNAVAAGADPATLAIVDQEDLPLAYLPGRAIRARVRVVGDVLQP